jgi:hypothetical protein
MKRLRSDELVVANSAELDACASDAGAGRLIRSVLQRRSRRCRWPRHPPPPRAPAGGYVVPAVCCQLNGSGRPTTVNRAKTFFSDNDVSVAPGICHDVFQGGDFTSFLMKT